MVIVIDRSVKTFGSCMHLGPERTRLVVTLVWLATSYIDLEQNYEI